MAAAAAPPIPDAAMAWEQATAADGVDLPIHVGMTGPVPLKELLRYAVRYGISASMRMLLGRTSALSRPAAMASVDELILAFAGHLLAHPEARMTRAHFFAFGGAERTAGWLKSVLAGEFEISPGHRIVTAGN